MNTKTLMATLAATFALATLATSASAQALKNPALDLKDTAGQVISTTTDPNTGDTMTRQYRTLPADGTLGHGAPLMKGLSGPNELADLTEASLKADPTGHSLLSAKLCRLNGSCATPLTYLEGLQKWHPRAGLTSVAELPQHFRALTKGHVDGEFYSARMLGYKLDLLSGFHRKLMDGEPAWINTQTGEAELMENCGNVMRPVEIQEVVVTAHCLTPTIVVSPNTVRVLVMIAGPTQVPVSGRCAPSYKRPGDTAFLPGTTPCPEHCFETKRDGSPGKLDMAIARGRDVSQHMDFMYEVSGGGLQKFRMPSYVKKGYTVLVCEIVRDPVTGRLSSPIGSYMDFKAEKNYVGHFTPDGEEFPMAPPLDH